ncbi:MAG: hypothetical protein ABIG66_01370 [Candidatus Kerfeldbacteria bacterium]
MKLRREKTPRLPKATEVIGIPEPPQEDVRFNPETDITEEDWEGMKQELDSHRQGSRWWSFAPHAMEMSILFPDRKKELGLDEEAWEGIKQQLDSSRQRKLWGHFASRAMEMSTLFPDRKQELGLDEEAWNGMKKTLDSYHQDNEWWGFASLAMNMSILSADRVDITPEGQLKITPKKLPLAKPQPLPERSSV